MTTAQIAVSTSQIAAEVVVGAMQTPANATIARLPEADAVRRLVSPCISPEHKSALGQFMTPSPIARFMASLFVVDGSSMCRLLDAGAGMGALSCAFIDRWLASGFPSDQLDLLAVEVDDVLRKRLAANLAGYTCSGSLRAEIIDADFIEWAVNALQFGIGRRFTHAILNPPYKKIFVESRHRQLLRQAGIETVNLYSGFMALALSLLVPGGQLVAIVPRSFCNGPYYRPFREFVLERAAIRRMHLFASRRKAFKDDDVLQENVIITLERGGRQGAITVSTSTDGGFTDMRCHEYPFHRIVFLDDPEHFVHVPTSPGPGAIELAPSIRYSLDDLGIKVSTGPVVDFRMREHIRDLPGQNTVPLLYPCHFADMRVDWPKPNGKKPNAIVYDSVTEKWLYPSGSYCVVRRFSSKEERRRIVASVVDPAVFGAAPMLGFENHLNVFHNGKHGLPKALAFGLAAFLNTTAVDESFRRFNGHTQVNATDLRQIKYPSRDALMALGEWAMRPRNLSQADLDARFGILAS